MRKDGSATFEKRVDIVAKQSDEQLITGVVMRPNEVDLQHDYATPEQIADFAGQFQALYDEGSADGGIMHSVFPSEWLELVANGIYGKVFPEDAPIPDDVSTFTECVDWAEDEDDIDDPESFCGFYHIPEDELVAGDWIQTWKVTDDDLYELIDAGIISGFSIGARDVQWRGPVQAADLPEGVGIPPELEDEEQFWEITDGIIREVSVVDIPAVPDAQILAKDDAAKRLGDYLGNKDEFMAEAQERGHAESEAERLWDVMNRANELDGSGSPGKSLLERVGKAALNAFRGEGESDDATGAEHQTRTTDTESKEGQTLSRKNRESLFATIDASLDILQDAGVDHGMQRFTDRDDWSFNLSDHASRAWPEDDDDDDDDDETEANADVDTQTMTDDTNDTGTDDPMDDAPEWAKSIHEQVEQNTEQIEAALASEEDADDGKDADADADGDGDEPPEWAADLTEQVQANADAIEQIGKQSGLSTQIGNADADGDGDGEKDAMDQITEVLS